MYSTWQVCQSSVGDIIPVRLVREKVGFFRFDIARFLDSNLNWLWSASASSQYRPMVVSGAVVLTSQLGMNSYAQQQRTFCGRDDL
jgi:hypothetical protein